jgi:hypothetical protein
MAFEELVTVDVLVFHDKGEPVRADARRLALSEGRIGEITMYGSLKDKLPPDVWDYPTR